ncbi:MAG: type II toxin-antitoxin system VapC family toxin [Roseiarcus sp.]|jgi:predicted nucleic acid-binding protein
MVLVDTSIWIDHLRRGDAKLARMLDEAKVLTHPFIIGEIALGNLRARDGILTAIDRLPKANVASDSEILHFIAAHSLWGLGIGLVDAHLLASVLLTRCSTLWTRDKKLVAAAKRLGAAAPI